MVNKRVFILLCSLILLTASVAFADDLPEAPERFYGNVTVGGEPAENGVKVSALIAGELVMSQYTIDGKYGYIPPATEEFCVYGEEGVEIEFQLNGVHATKVTLDHPMELTALDLDVESIPEDIERPNVYLFEPNDGFESKSKTVTFNFSVKDNHDEVLDYNLYIDSKVKQTGKATVGEFTTLDIKDLAKGSHKWYVKVEDSNANVNISPTRSFSVDVGGGGGGGSSPRHSSSSGGGGGGGSPEAQSNVEEKELAQAFVSNGKHARFDFKEEATCIQYVEFDAKKTAGKVTTVVEELKGKSELVSNLPSGIIYKNLNIWVGNSGTADPENIENAAIGFRVEKAWLEKHELEASDIALWHYDENWEKLETKKDREEKAYVYFKANTPGFSPFAIVAKGEVPAAQAGAEAEILPNESSSGEESKPTGEAQKSDESPGIPGFGVALSLGILGTLYCTLRRKM